MKEEYMIKMCLLLGFEKCWCHTDCFVNDFMEGVSG